MNQKIYEFTNVIKKVNGINWAYIEFPFDVMTMAYLKTEK